jgi:hypothetical protein
MLEGEAVRDLNRGVAGGLFVLTWVIALHDRRWHDDHVSDRYNGASVGAREMKRGRSFASPGCRGSYISYDSSFADLRQPSAIDYVLSRGRHPGGHRTRIPGIAGTSDPLNHAESA